jgi:hypothetical protein
MMPARPIESAATAHPWRSWLLPALGGLALTVGGCAEQDLETSYGGQRSLLSTASVNGTDVFANLFTAAGHEVDSRRVLITSAMQSVETIVWFPDDFAAPEPDVCQWFDQWLSDGSGRTLIYVGRDFDAAPLYWRKMAPLAPPDQQQAFRSRASQAALRARGRADANSDDLACDWFTIEPGDAGEPGDTGDLAGPWSQGIQADNAQLALGARLVPSIPARRQLTSGANLLVARARRPLGDGSQLILVANGSFLLNLPLVNHEHRKLAGQLIAAVGPGQVVFLESGPGGPPIDPPQVDNSLWTVFGAWPLNVVLLHLAVLGLIFCFARWPIFGRPRVSPDETTSDFGKHVDAMGELLRRTKDRNYALAKLAELEHVPATPVP